MIDVASFNQITAFNDESMKAMFADNLPPSPSDSGYGSRHLSSTDAPPCSASKPTAFNFDVSWMNINKLFAHKNGAVSSATPQITASVNIDNKIEQAMDLVKTHLMYAVREEVDRMRQQIAQLESKVLLLENENKILRQSMPPEKVNQILTTLSTTANTI